jgi:hypothetical protein
MKARCAALLVGTLLLDATKAGATTYAVSEFEGISLGTGVGIGGSITTDGTLGSINFSNLLDWNLIGTVILGSTTTFVFDFNSSNSVINNFVDITATANALTLGSTGDLKFDLLTSTGVHLPEAILQFAAVSLTMGGPVNATEFSVCTGLGLRRAV